MEHNRSIINKDEKSALSLHVQKCSCESVEDFDVDILQSARIAVDVALLEARFDQLWKSEVK